MGRALRRWRPAALVLPLAAALVVSAAACGGDDDAAPVPKVEWIEPALAAIEESAGGEPMLLEVAATLEQVDVIVQDAPGHGVLYRYTDESLNGPIEPRDDDRPTFAPDEVAVDTDTIFDTIRRELPENAILDLAVRKEGEAMVIDSTVANEQGGILLVLLGPDGSILGSQAG